MDRPTATPGGPDDASLGRALIELMVRSDVLSFGDFVGKSGRRMPYFVNSGNYRTGAQVAELGRLYAEAISTTFGDDVDVVFGPAYKGIPLAVSTVVALAEHHGRDLAFCFDRKEVKDHGEGGALIGHQPRDGDRIVIVEDVTTAGTSIREAVPMLRAIADVNVVGLVVGVDRREHAGQPDRSALDELAEDFGLTTVALTTIDDIVHHLTTNDGDGARLLGDDDLDRLAAYRAEYGVQ